VAEAREPAKEAVRKAPWEPGSVRFLAALLARAGDKNRAEKLLATIPETNRGGMATYHLVLSEIDAAIDSYERDLELHSLRATFAASAGYAKPLRAHPRWPKLAKMMNLPVTK
jgi:hypothetical protein